MAEKITAVLFFMVFIAIIGRLILAKRSISADQIDDDFQYDFSDNYNNFYRVVEHRGAKLLLRIPDEVYDWEQLNRWSKSKQIEKSEAKVKKGELEKIEISGATIYLAKSAKMKDFILHENKLRSTNW